MWIAQREGRAKDGVDRTEPAIIKMLSLSRDSTAWMTRYQAQQAERTGVRDEPASSWRLPLLAAMRLAPGHPEPPLFLASASLSRWSSLTAAERREAMPVLTRALP